MKPKRKIRVSYCGLEILSSKTLTQTQAETKKTRKHGNCQCIATWMPPDVGSVPIRFNYDAHTKCEVAQPVRCRLRAFLLLIRYVMLWPWPFNLWPLTLNTCNILAVPWSNSVPNLSEIEQSSAELLRLEYLTLWPWTCIMCCAMLRIVCTV